MKSNRYVPISLVAVAIFAGCSSVPKNDSLNEARSQYDSARSDAKVTELAPIELKEAGDSLNMADYALKQGDKVAKVDHLAYVAKQKVKIAEETAKRKLAELEVANASTKRDQIRLAARTAEVDAAKQQMAIVQKTVDQQAAELATAKAGAERDLALLETSTAQTDAANQQLALEKKAADQQSLALATANANAERDRVRLDESAAKTDASNRQLVLAQESANRKTIALAAAGVDSERDQARIARQDLLLEELNAKKTARGLVITLGDVLFSVNKAELQSGGTRNLQKLAEFLKTNPKEKVLIEGFTDSTGSNSLNKDLSERRAESVRTALLNMGINGDRFSTRGYGEAFPIAGNDTAANRQMNRRVEIILTDSEAEVAPR